MTRSATAETRSLTLSDGYKITYTRIGDASKPLLLFVVGGSGLGSLYHRLAIELSPYFQCVYYDKRGFRSKTPTNGSLTSSCKNFYARTEQHAEDAAALVQHLSPCQPAYVFGTSTGGAAVLDLTIRYPELVHTAILHEPITFSVVTPSELRDEMIGLYRRVGSHQDPFEGLADFAEYMFAPPKAQAQTTSTNASAKEERNFWPRNPS